MSRKYTIASRKDALGRNFIRKENKREVPFFLPSKKFFTPITKKSIQPGDWLAEHDERGQMFSQYNNFNQVYRGKNTIYIVPLEDVESNEHFQMSDLASFIEAYFGGCVKVKVQDTKRIKGFKKDAKGIKTRENDYGDQLFIPDIFAILKRIVPKDAYACIAISSRDLYPAEDWNYVYGKASLVNRIGVFSFRRYIGGDVFKRISRLSVHELGHIFGLRHCIYYQCMMNGFNGPGESFRRPPRLCPVCIRKLKKNCKFSVRERYNNLLEVYRKHDQKDQEEWVLKRLEYVDDLTKKKTTLLQFQEMFNKMR